MTNDKSAKALPSRRYILSASVAGAVGLQAQLSLAKANGKPKKVRPLKTWLTYAVNAEMFWSKLPFLELAANSF